MTHAHDEDSKATEGADGAEALRIVDKWYNWIVATSEDMDTPEGEATEGYVRRLDEQREVIRSSLAALPPPTGEPVAWRVRVNENGRIWYVYTERLPYTPDDHIKVLSEPEPLFAASPQVEPAEDVSILEGVRRIILDIVERFDERRGTSPDELADYLERIPEYLTAALASQSAELLSLRRKVEETQARLKSEWHEDHGDVVWWTWKGDNWLGEPSYIGSPLDTAWPGYHTHWTPHPASPAAPRQSGESGK